MNDDIDFFATIPCNVSIMEFQRNIYKFLLARVL